jgi:YidC/Oxa1 family membrane protein insertase
LTRHLRSAARFLPAVILIAAVTLVLAACLPGGQTGSGAPGSHTPPPGAIPLRPAELKADPISLFSWLFTPIFQAMFIVLVAIDLLVKNIAIAIIGLTLLLRLLMVPIFRRQTVNTKQMQLVGPEVRELQRRYKGDRLKSQAAVAEFYKQRGINPASGCLPLLLTLGLLIPVYSVVSQGLTNYDVNPMLNVFGIQLITLPCDASPILDANNHVVNACLKPIAFGRDWSRPDVSFTVFGFGISILAIISALFQLVQSRMALPPPNPAGVPDEPQIRVQRQMAYFLPFISILWGTLLPAGLFLYWIFGTILATIQQYLILGWGGTFPLFGWTPSFARDHTPRFPVRVPAPKAHTDASGKPITTPKPAERSAAAQKTIRTTKRERDRGRRGRRR